MWLRVRVRSAEGVAGKQIRRTSQTLLELFISQKRVGRQNFISLIHLTFSVTAAPPLLFPGRLGLLWYAARHLQPWSFFREEMKKKLSHWGLFFSFILLGGCPVGNTFSPELYRQNIQRLNSSEGCLFGFLGSPLLFSTHHVPFFSGRIPFSKRGRSLKIEMSPALCSPLCWHFLIHSWV